MGEDLKMFRPSPMAENPTSHELPSGTRSSFRSRSSRSVRKERSRSRNDDRISNHSSDVREPLSTDASAVGQTQLDGIEEHDNYTDVDNNDIWNEWKEHSDIPEVIPGLDQNVVGGDFTLSDERSRRRMDSDLMSETDTIVPRRNLSVLDVASLIFNKMVSCPNIRISKNQLTNLFNRLALGFSQRQARFCCIQSQSQLV